MPARVVRVCARLQLDPNCSLRTVATTSLECLLVAARVERVAANPLEASNSTYEEISHQLALVEVKFGSGSSCAIYASHAPSNTYGTRPELSETSKRAERHRQRRYEEVGVGLAPFTGCWARKIASCYVQVGPVLQSHSRSHEVSAEDR